MNSFNKRTEEKKYFTRHSPKTSKLVTQLNQHFIFMSFPNSFRKMQKTSWNWKNFISINIKIELGAHLYNLHAFWYRCSHLNSCYPGIFVLSRNVIRVLIFLSVFLVWNEINLIFYQIFCKLWKNQKPFSWSWNFLGAFTGIIYQMLKYKIILFERFSTLTFWNRISVLINPFRELDVK